MAAVKVNEHGQIVIPLEVRLRRGWAPGTELEVVDRGGEVALVPAAPPTDMPRAGTFRDHLSRFARSADSGLSTDDVMSLTRGDD